MAVPISLEQKQSALETVYKLSYALDALNYHDIAEVFHPNRTFRFDISAILGQPAKDVTPAEYFETATGGLGGFDATQHVVTNPGFDTHTDADGRVHLKTLVTAFHGIVVDGNVEGAIARVTWNMTLEHDKDKDKDKWVIVDWVIKGLMPIDRPDIFKQGHQRAHEGKLRSIIVGP